MQLSSHKILTSKLFRRIGSNFLSELLEGSIHNFFGFEVTIIKLNKKKANECSGRLDEITHFPHSAWSSDAITESQSLRWFWRIYYLATFTCLLRSFSNDVRKMLIASKGSDTFHQHHFRFLITFNASVLQREPDAPNPTPNQSTRLTLPKQGATLKLLKNDRQIVKRNMEKLSPCHAEVWENYSKKSIENQSLNKFDKKHNTLIFHQEKRFREFCQQASTWNTYFDP